MDKSCGRCESEAKIAGLPIGNRCLDALRAELAGYDEVLEASELDRLARRRDELAAKIEPDLEELQRVEARIEELLGSEKDKVEAAILAAENVELAAEADKAEAAELAAEAELLEIRKLEAELAEEESD